MTSLDYSNVTASDGTRIHRWERVPEGATEAVCFVHGATYGGRSAFAPDDFSWLEAVAASGRAAFALDVHGYGQSERPPELDAPAGESGPVVRAPRAARDAAAAYDNVRAEYDVLHLVGYSWGTITSGVLLTELGFDAESLVQYAPVYRASADRWGDSDFDAYRRVTREDARERWAAQRADSVPDDAFEAFWATLSDSNQHAGESEIVAPNGTYADLAASVEEPQYDATAIDVPTLVVRGTRDTASVREDALALYDDLGTPDATYTEIAGGTHFLQLEEHRERLYATVKSFHDRLS